MREITLQEVLDAREARAAAQRRLLDKHRRPLLCLTMNIAGPVKRWGTVDLAFRSGAAELDQRLGGRVLERGPDRRPPQGWSASGPATSPRRS